MGRKPLGDGNGKPGQEQAGLAEGVVAGGPSAVDLEAELADNLGRICTAVSQQTGHDFASYKQGTLLRRMQRRLQFLHLATAADYLQVLECDRSEAEALVKELLIGVTQFFRDSEAFAALAQQVLPLLVKGRPAEATIRVWVAGCASGEEAYSIAILLREQLERAQTPRLVQIFATDLDTEMLAEARQGRYPLSIAEQVSGERLARFFVREGDRYQAVKELREMCVFCQHSLIRDPPFSQLDLISCRNVLIYMSAELQKKLMPVFHYALRPGGFLFLGPSEGTASFPELFENADQKNRFFRRKDTMSRPLVELPLALRAPARPSACAPAPAAAGVAGPSSPGGLAAAFERIVLDEYSWPSLLVDERGTIVLAAGQVGRYLQPFAGAPTPNLLDAARGNLRRELRTALQAAAETRRRVVRDEVTADSEDTARSLRLVVRPMPSADPATRLYLVILQERAPARDAAADAAATPAAFDTPALQQLEGELRGTRAELKSSREAADAANEELKSSNEELISTNEELQSANEELQNSKEELHSLNEELETVNAELRQTVDELAAANSDLQNLFAATEIATVFLDRSLRVAKFTPAATALFHLIDSDVGRPLADLAPRFPGQDLLSDARTVLRTLLPIERQVRAAEGGWFVLRVLPYRTLENVVAGVLLTLVDISAVKRAEDMARQQAELVHLSHDAIFVRRFDGTIESWNRGAEELYGFTREEAVGRRSHDLLGTDFPQSLAELEAELRRSGSWTGELRHHTKDGRHVTVLSNMQLARTEDGEEHLLEANRDVTERKRAEEEQRRLLGEVRAQKERLSALVGSMRDEVWFADPEKRFTLANPAAVREFALGREDVDVERLVARLEVYRPDGSPRPVEEAPPLRALGGEVVLNQEEMVRTPGTGELRYRQVNASPVRDDTGRIIGSVSVVRDITAQKQAEAERERSAAQRQLALDAARMGWWHYDPVTRIATYDARYREIFGVSGHQRPTDEILKLLHPDDLPRVWAAVEAALDPADPKPYTATYRIKRPDGQVRWIEAHGLATFAGEGPERHALSFVGTVADITARREAEEAVRQSEARWNAAIEHLGEGAIIATEAEQVIYWNPAAQAMHGFRRPDEGIGPLEETPNTFELWTPDASHRLELDEWPMRRIKRGETVRHLELRLRRPDQRWERIVSYSGALVETAGGERLIFLSVHDLTEQRQAEIALREADRHKNEFLAVLSHELRNPLAPITNSLYILDHAPPGGDQANRAREVIGRQVGQLSHLVNDLLDVTRITRGKVQLSKERMELGEAVRRAVEDNRSTFERAGIRLVSVSAPGPIWLRADGARIAQVVDNLLQNAAKFTRPGGSTQVTTAVEGHEAVIYVVDDGVGMAPETLGRLFQPFMQADQTLDRSGGGLGLGLALVKGLVELHGGSVSAHSEGLGRGSELVVRLPMDEGADLKPRASSPSTPAARRRRILIIEDNVDAAESLCEALGLSEHQVTVAYNGADGLARAREVLPEVVLCDLGLPGMDGFAVARALRADEALRGTFLVALSGYALPEDVQRAMEAGFQHHLAKPPSIEKLEELLAILPASG